MFCKHTYSQRSWSSSSKRCWPSLTLAIHWSKSIQFSTKMKAKKLGFSCSQREKSPGNFSIYDSLCVCDYVLIYVNKPKQQNKPDLLFYFSFYFFFYISIHMKLEMKNEKWKRRRRVFYWPGFLIRVKNEKSINK